MDKNNIFSLKGKTVLITGGNGHLGSAMSQIVSQYGAQLVLASTNSKKNDETKKNLEKYNNTVHTVSLDLSDEKSVKECVSQVHNICGSIDVLINNSYYGAGSKFHEMTQEQWLKGIDGSINAAFRMTKAVLPSMIENKKGKIINISSMYGVVAPDVSIYKDNDYYNPANYGVGKAGIIQFTKYIASVYGKDGITCNAISPGPFPSKTVQKNKNFIEHLENKVPLGRIGIPDDLKGIVLLLASSASDYINGTNIMVDGGWTAW